MRRIIILLLCCGVLVSMAGCSGNTAPPPTESPPTTVLETTTTKTPTQTTPPVAVAKPTEKENKPITTESKEQATEPIVTVTESTTQLPKEETKPTAPTKSTEPSATENIEPEEETPPKTEEPQEEIYVGKQWPEVDPADIEKLVIKKINAYRIARGDTAATVLPGLMEVARYRANELATNFEHRGEQHVSTELKYGQYVDLAPYGLPDDSYYKGYSREAIGMGDWFGTAESMSDRIADGFYYSKGHWSYVGSSKYPYIAVGIAKANEKWYVCILMSDNNYGG